MQVSVELLDGLERRMTVQVPAQQIDGEVQKRLRDMSRRVRLDGFRPGKVPMKIVQKRYGEQVRADVVGDLLQSTYVEALKQEQLNPAGGPTIDAGPPAEGKDYEYRATFEVYPDVEVRGVEEFEIQRPVAEVTQQDVERMLEKLRKQRTIWNTVARPAATGDRVTVDFVGRIEGEEFAGGKSEDFAVILGAGMTIPEFESNLEGASTDDQRSFDATFPKDYNHSDLAGKTATFEVTVKDVAESTLPDLDDDFVKSFGVEDGRVESLKKQLKENMERELDQGIRGKVKDQVMECLLTHNEVAVPSALVDQEIRSLLRQSGAKLPDEQSFPVTDAMRDHYGEEARRRVALGLLVGEIVKAHGLTPDEAEVNKYIEDLAGSYEQPDQVRTWYRQNPQALEGVRAMALENQVVDWVLATARVTEQSSSFAEIMNPGWD